jgi:hypothetical protein
MSETYYPPRSPIEPPHNYIHPNWLITAECSAVELLTEQGLPDIKGYLFMRKAIDIHKARNPVEIRLFQRISTLEALVNLVGVPEIAQERIEICFYIRGVEMRGTQPGFWAVFHAMYVKDMLRLREMLLSRYPGLMQCINWDFLLRDPSTDVAVMVYLWILGIWHTIHNSATTGLFVLGSQLCMLVPCQLRSDIAGREVSRQEI